MANQNNEDRLTEVEKDTVHLQAFIEKLDASVEKLTTISADVAQMLAVHENRLTFQERLQSQLESKIDKKNEAIDDRFGKMYDRVDEVKNELLKEISDNTTKISTVEKWMWTCFGGGAVIWLILGKIPFHL